MGGRGEDSHPDHELRKGLSSAKWPTLSSGIRPSRRRHQFFKLSDARDSERGYRKVEENTTEGKGCQFHENVLQKMAPEGLRIVVISKSEEEAREQRWCSTVTDECAWAVHVIV